MAKVTRLVCDLNQTHEATGTVHFSVNGEAFSMDLCADDASKFEKALAPYVKSGTSVDFKELVKKFSANGSSDVDLTAVREWAGKNGHTVAPKGRIATEVIDAYKAAHKK